MASQTKVFNTRDPDQQKREYAVKRYQANYRRIYGSISGRWFSFGDERLLKKAFRELASTTHGQQILANLGDDFKGISSDTGLAHGANGAYAKDSDNVKIESAFLSEDNQFHATGVLAHELLHANQDRMGFLDNKGLSPRQAVQRDLLCEAETFGWQMSMSATNKFFGKINPSKEEIQQLLSLDKGAIDKKMDEILKNSPVTSSEDKAHHREILTTFYDNLKKSGGNLYYAQRKAVGVAMSKFMNADSNSSSTYGQVKKAYEDQAVRVTGIDMQDLSSKGNNQEVQRHYNYLAQQYGVSRAQLERTPLSSRVKAELASVEENVAVRESFEKDASLIAQKAPGTLSNAARRNITHEDSRSRQPTSHTQSEGRG
ncbi:MAG: hypothetical protein IJY92_06025 [Alphaproteobacteria bacterium]|nr:hypothetical protein [Alphaproteobacteria bacterium]